jgi:hypothetical protein
MSQISHTKLTLWLAGLRSDWRFDKHYFLILMYILMESLVFQSSSLPMSTNLHSVMTIAYKQVLKVFSLLVCLLGEGQLVNMMRYFQLVRDATS